MIFSGIVIASVLFLWFSCAGTQNLAPETETGVSAEAVREDTGLAENVYSGQSDSSNAIIRAAPSELIFLPGSFPSLEIAMGVGFITRDLGDLTSTLDNWEKTAITASYRRGYVDYLLRDAPLDGVLGGDLVHSWPRNDPSGWVQNWRSSAPENNSFGLPNLILAIQGRSADRVFIVQSRIMDQYGKSSGLRGANGKMGYGAPRGYEFFYDGKIAQRFDLGLISVDTEGRGSFLPEDPPSLEFSPSPDIGVFINADSLSKMPIQKDLQAAFIEVCVMALDQGIKSMVPDGEGQYLPITGGSWDFPDGENLKGIYFQSFNRQSILLVLPDSSLLPPYPRFIAPPFIDVLLHSSDYSLLGAQYLKAMDIKYSGGDALAHSLMKGLSYYGVPLTDPVAVKGGEGSSSPWQAAQRFSRGWLVGPPSIP